MSIYFPLSSKIFGSCRIHRDIRMRLFSCLVISRLLYNVHVWSVLPRSAYEKLNAVYMKGLRRIAGMMRFKSTGHGYNEQVRRELDAPSLQCLIVRRRLLLLSSLSQFAPPLFSTLLAARDSTHTQCLPWVRLVMHDLTTMFFRHAANLAELGDPQHHADRWYFFARDFPIPWKTLVNCMFFHTMPLDRVEEKQAVSFSACSHACEHCSERFASQKALWSLQRAKHKVRSSLESYLPSSGVCPVCRLKFASRPRLLAHVSETRQRGRQRIRCRDLIQAGLVVPLDPADLQAARLSDNLLRKDAFKRGLTQPKSEMHAKRRAISSAVPPICCKRQHGFQYAEFISDGMPENAIWWEDIVPEKRLRTKTPLDVIALDHLK